MSPNSNSDSGRTTRTRNGPCFKAQGGSRSLTSGCRLTSPSPCGSEHRRVASAPCSERVSWTSWQRGAAGARLEHGFTEVAQCSPQLYFPLPYKPYIALCIHPSLV